MMTDFISCIYASKQYMISTPSTTLPRQVNQAALSHPLHDLPEAFLFPLVDLLLLESPFFEPEPDPAPIHASICGMEAFKRDH
jgi:hypothetical protein